MSSKNNYEGSQSHSKHGFIDPSEYQSYMGSQKGDKSSAYSQKGSIYMEEDIKINQSHHPYAYTQQAGYPKGLQGHDSGTKKDPKGSKDQANLYAVGKGQYQQGKKGRIEVSNIAIPPHQGSYYPPQYQHPNPPYPMIPGSKHKNFMHMPHEIGKDDPSDELNFDTADFSHQEKINKLMHITREQNIYHEMGRRNQGGHGYPPASEFLPGYSEDNQAAIHLKSMTRPNMTQSFDKTLETREAQKNPCPTKLASLSGSSRKESRYPLPEADLEISDRARVRGARREGQERARAEQAAELLGQQKSRRKS